MIDITNWHTCKALVWRLSKTLDVSIYVETLTDLQAKYGKPDAPQLSGKPVPKIRSIPLYA